MPTMTHYSPFLTAVQDNPYPHYDWLRREYPVYYNECHDFWVLSRYHDVVKAVRTPEIFSSALGVGLDKRYGLSMIAHDPPDHTRLRKLVVKAFTPRQIASYEPRIQAIIDDLLDDVIAKGSFELVEDLAGGQLLHRAVELRAVAAGHRQLQPLLVDQHDVRALVVPLDVGVLQAHENLLLLPVETDHGPLGEDMHVEGVLGVGGLVAVQEAGAEQHLVLDVPDLDRLL